MADAKNQTAHNQHPNQQTIESFAHGLLEESAADSVAAHIENCDTCCQAVQTVPVDKFSVLARAVGNAAAKSLPPLHATSGKHEDSEVAAALGTVERYRLIDRVGSGGMGEVYRAQHKLMNRMVAIKVISSALTGDEHAISRFRNEARAAARLTHPNIVASYDADNVGDLHFLVMELVEGKNLAALVKENGPVAPNTVVRFAHDAASGLAAAHAQGMVHRDIKPHNLMVDNGGCVKILDFGLARFERAQPELTEIAAQSGGLTGANMAMGTPDYLAPEQAKDATQVDIRSDIYSLGCTLYFLLTGQPPFPSGGPVEKIAGHLAAQPTSLTELRHDLPPQLVQVIQRMMEKAPEDRFQTPDDLLTDLQSLNSNRPLEKPATKKQQSKWLLAGLAAALASAAIFSATSTSPASAPAPRVLIVSSNEVFYSEYEPVRNALQSRNVQVVTAAEDSLIRSVDETKAPPFDADMLLEDVDPDLFDAVVFVGGHNEEILTGTYAASEVTRIVSAIERKKGAIAAMCGGEGVLEHLGFEYELSQANELKGSEVFSAEGVVTATEPRFAERFADQLLEVILREKAEPEQPPPAKPER